MLQAGGETAFPMEPLGIDLGGQLGRQHLDHYPPVERGLGRDEDPAHAAATELALDPIGRPKRGL
jgi:hypothetical protein